MAEKLTRRDIIEKIIEQIQLLQLSAENFDKGLYMTTLYMATTIRVLFHDTATSVSLIKQLCDIDGMDKNMFEMVSTRKPHKEGELVLVGDGLFSLAFGFGGIQCIPFFEHATQTKVPFSYWWDEEVVKNVENGYESPTWLSRKDIIILHANKEGGAHVDVVRNEKISNLSKKEALGFTSYYTNLQGESIEQETIIDPKKATVRQICFEVLESLYNYCPELFLTEYADPFKKATAYY